jgi:hypothetical protein
MVFDAKRVFKPSGFEQFCREAGLGDAEGEDVRRLIRMGEFLLQDQDQQKLCAVLIFTILSGPARQNAGSTGLVC